MSGEVLHGRECSKCDRVALGCKQLTLVNCPSMLILHLARFCFEDGQVSKNESKVGVPENVVVATTMYRLLAVVKHKGSRHTGHYIAEIRSERGWLLCNDARVERIEKQSMEYCSDAYILFYEAVPSQDLPVSDTPEKGGPTTSLNE